MANAFHARSSRFFLASLPRILGLGIFLSTMVVALNPDSRALVREFIVGKDRHVLSILRDVSLNGRLVDILKVSTPRGVQVEIYDRGNGFHELVATALIEDRTDAFYMLRGRASNLFATDLDGDGQIEIAAPTYDRNLVAHLNVLNLRQLENKIEIVHGP